MEDFKYMITAGFKIDTSELKRLVTEVTNTEQKIRAGLGTISINLKADITPTLSNIDLLLRKLRIVKDEIRRINLMPINIGAGMAGVAGAMPGLVSGGGVQPQQRFNQVNTQQQQLFRNLAEAKRYYKQANIEFETFLKQKEILYMSEARLEQIRVKSQLEQAKLQRLNYIEQSKMQIAQARYPVAIAEAEAQKRALYNVGIDTYTKAKEEGYLAYTTPLARRAEQRSIMKEGLASGGNIEAVRRQVEFIEKERARYSEIAKSTGQRFIKSFEIIDPKSGEILKTTTYLFDEMGRTIDRTDNSLQRMGASMLRNMVFYHAAVMGIYGIVYALQDCMRFMTEFELQWARMKVLFEKREISPELSQAEIFKLSQEYGTDPTQTAKIMQKALKQREIIGNVPGQREANIDYITRGVLTAINVSTMDEVEATEKLVATLRGFNLEASETPNILDNWVYLFNESSASIDDIADGMAKIGNIAKEVGATPSFTAASLATLVSATGESGSEAANSIRIFMRKMMAARGAEVIKQIAKVDIYSAPGEFKPFEQVYEEFAKAWATLNQAQKNLLATSLAERRTPDFMAFMSHADEILSRANPQDIEGGALQRNREIMETTIKQWQAFKSVLGEFSVELGQSGILSGIKALVGALTTMLKLVTEMLKAFNELPTPIKNVTMGVLGLAGAVSILKVAVETLGFVRGKGKVGSGAISTISLGGDIAKTAGTIVAGETVGALATGAVTSGGIRGAMSKVGGFLTGRNTPTIAAEATGFVGVLGKVATNFLKILGPLALFATAIQGAAYVIGKFNEKGKNVIDERIKGIGETTSKADIARELDEFAELTIKRSKKGLSEDESATLKHLMAKYGIIQNKMVGGELAPGVMYFNYVDEEGKLQKITLAGGKGIKENVEEIKKIFGSDKVSLESDISTGFSYIFDFTNYEKTLKSIKGVFQDFDSILKTQTSQLELTKLKWDNLTGSVGYAYEAMSNINSIQQTYSDQIAFIGTRLPVYTQNFEKHANVISTLREVMGEERYGALITEWEGTAEDERDDFASKGGSGETKIRALFAEYYPKYTESKALVGELGEQYQKAVLEVQKLNKEKLDLILNTDKYIVYWDSVQERIRTAKSLMSELRDTQVELSNIDITAGYRQLILGKDFQKEEYTASKYEAARDKSLTNLDNLTKLISTYAEDQKKISEAENEAQASYISRIETNVVSPLESIIKNTLNSEINNFGVAVDSFGTTTEEFKTFLEKVTSVGFESSYVETGDYIKDLIGKTAASMGIDPNLATSVAESESGIRHYDERFNIVESPSGALGVMQLMPGTAAGLGVDPYNLEQNVKGGVTYIKQKLQEWNNNVPLALAAYNAGNVPVQKWVNQAGSTDWSKIRELAYDETREYVEYTLRYPNLKKYLGGDTNVGYVDVSTQNNTIKAGEEAHNKIIQQYSSEFTNAIINQFKLAINNFTIANEKYLNAIEELDIKNLAGAGRIEQTSSIYHLKQSTLEELLILQQENNKNIAKYNYDTLYQATKLKFDQAPEGSTEKIVAGLELEALEKNSEEIKKLYTEIQKNNNLIAKEIFLRQYEIRLDPKYNQFEAQKTLQNILMDLSDVINKGGAGSYDFMHTLEDLFSTSNLMLPAKQQEQYSKMFQDFGIGYELFAEARMVSEGFKQAILSLKLMQIEDYLKTATGTEAEYARDDKYALINAEYAKRNERIENEKKYYENIGDYTKAITTSVQQFADNLYRIYNTIKETSKMIGITSNTGIVALLELFEAESERINILNQEKEALKTAYITGHIGLKQYIESMEELRDTAMEFAEQSLNLYQGSQDTMQNSFVGALVGAMTSSTENSYKDLSNSLKQGMASLIAEQVGNALMNSVLLQPFFTRISTMFSGLAGSSLSDMANQLSGPEFKSVINDTMNVLYPIMTAIADATEGTFETLQDNMYNAPKGFRIEPYLYEYVKGTIKPIGDAAESSAEKLKDAGEQITNISFAGKGEKLETVDLSAVIPDKLQEIVSILQSINDSLSTSKVGPLETLNVQDMLLLIAKFNYMTATSDIERESAAMLGKLARSLGITFDPNNTMDIAGLADWLQNKGLSMDEFGNIMSNISEDDDLRNKNVVEKLRNVVSELLKNSDINKSGFFIVSEAINNIKISGGDNSDGGSNPGGINPPPGGSNPGGINPPPGGSTGGNSSGGNSSGGDNSGNKNTSLSDIIYIRSFFEGLGYSVNWNPNNNSINIGSGKLVLYPYDYGLDANENAYIYWRQNSKTKSFLNSLGYYHEGGYVSPFGPKALAPNEVPMIAKNGELFVNTDNMSKVDTGVNLTISVDARGSNWTEEQLETIVKRSVASGIKELDKQRKSFNLRTKGVSY